MAPCARAIASTPACSLPETPAPRPVPAIEKNGTNATPCSPQASANPCSAALAPRKYRFCTQTTGATAWASASCSGVTPDTPRCRISPASRSAARAPKYVGERGHARHHAQVRPRRDDRGRAGGPDRVITLSDRRRRLRRHAVPAQHRPCSRRPGSRRSPCWPKAAGLRAHKSMPMQQAAEAHRQLESGDIHERIILTLESRRAPELRPGQPLVTCRRTCMELRPVHRLGRRAAACPAVSACRSSPADCPLPQERPRCLPAAADPGRACGTARTRRSRACPRPCRALARPPRRYRGTRRTCSTCAASLSSTTSTSSPASRSLGVPQLIDALPGDPEHRCAVLIGRGRRQP